MKFIKTILFLLFLGLFFQTVCLAQEVSFIHITDINLDKSNAPKVLQTIREINTYEDVDFVVFGGDNIAKADIDNLDMFLYILSQVKKKCIVLLGSNDVSTTSEIDKEYYLKRNIQLLDSKETDQIKKLSQDCMMFLTILKSTPVSKPKQDSNTERIDYENASNDASNGYNKSYESHNINKLNEKIDNPVYPNTSL